MLVELEAGNLVTLPEKFLEKFGLCEGDKLEIFERDGAIFIFPVAIYSREYTGELAAEAVEIKKEFAARKAKIFDDAGKLIDALEVGE